MENNEEATPEPELTERKGKRHRALHFLLKVSGVLPPVSGLDLSIGEAGLRRQAVHAAMVEAAAERMLGGQEKPGDVAVPPHQLPPGGGQL